MMAGTNSMVLQQQDHLILQWRLQGFCYVYYANAEAAAAAMDHLNGAEFPPNSGHRLKVSFSLHRHLLHQARGSC